MDQISRFDRLRGFLGEKEEPSPFVCDTISSFDLEFNPCASIVVAGYQPIAENRVQLSSSVRVIGNSTLVAFSYEVPANQTFILDRLLVNKTSPAKTKSNTYVVLSPFDKKIAVDWRRVEEYCKITVCINSKSSEPTEWSIYFAGHYIEIVDAIFETP